MSPKSRKGDSRIKQLFTKFNFMPLPLGLGHIVSPSDPLDLAARTEDVVKILTCSPLEIAFAIEFLPSLAGLAIANGEMCLVRSESCSIS